jgi:hypothetical protein
VLPCRVSSAGGDEARPFISLRSEHLPHVACPLQEAMKQEAVRRGRFDHHYEAMVDRCLLAEQEEVDRPRPDGKDAPTRHVLLVRLGGYVKVPLDTSNW